MKSLDPPLKIIRLAVGCILIYVWADADQCIVTYAIIIGAAAAKLETKSTRATATTTGNREAKLSERTRTATTTISTTTQDAPTTTDKTEAGNYSAYL